MAFIMSFNQRYEEMDELRKIFMSLDKSNDGMLTIDEVREGLIQVMGNFRGNMREFEEIMVDLDKDCNGVIDYSEFLTAAINKNQLINARNLKIAFQMIDRDHSGQITIDELKNVFEMHMKKDDQLWNSIMKEVDKNKDGFISYEEFEEVMNKAVQQKY